MLGAVQSAIAADTDDRDHANATDTTDDTEEGSAGVHDDLPETVAAATGRTKIYHDPDDSQRCHTAGDTREVGREVIAPHYRPCRHCFDV